MKKKWKKPALRIIVRNKPEEAVLTGCKTNTQPNGPDFPGCAAVLGGPCKVDTGS